MRNSDRADGIRQRHAALSPALDERQLRRWAAREAKAFGYGGVSLVARISGLARSTLHAGLAELENPPEIGRVRKTVGSPWLIANILSPDRLKRAESIPELYRAMTTQSQRWRLRCLD